MGCQRAGQEISSPLLLIDEIYLRSARTTSAQRPCTKREHGSDALRTTAVRGTHTREHTLPHPLHLEGSGIRAATHARRSRHAGAQLPHPLHLDGTRGRAAETGRKGQGAHRSQQPAEMLASVRQRSCSRRGFAPYSRGDAHEQHLDLDDDVLQEKWHSPSERRSPPPDSMSASAHGDTDPSVRARGRRTRDREQAYHVNNPDIGRHDAREQRRGAVRMAQNLATLVPPARSSRDSESLGRGTTCDENQGHADGRYTIHFCRENVSAPSRGECFRTRPRRRRNELNPQTWFSGGVYWPTRRIRGAKQR